MTIQNTGGPAFPSSHNNGDGIRWHNGMTLRDYFAAKTMQAIVSSIDGEDNYLRLRKHAEDKGMNVSQWIARDAYKQADAMLVERRKS